MKWSEPPRRADDVHAIQVDDDVVVFHATTAAVANLEGTASITWQLIDGQTPTEQIIDELAGAFGAPREVIAADVASLFDGLADMGFLLAGDDVPDGPNSASTVLPDPPRP